MRWLVAGALLAIVAVAADRAEARGLGRFVSSMVARGAISATAHGAGAAHATYSKNYTPDILTVDQLVTCLKKANVLDNDSEQLETKRAEIQASSKELDNIASRIELKQATINRRDQFQIDRFNAEVDAYNAAVARQKVRNEEFNRQVGAHNSSASLFNADCAKKYYGDDMEAARKLAGL